ncbi:peptidase M16C associated-domain-containing protein [Lipomyces oligophaga]|uniref:peptidase M16C associated-domain-containing protein n=1 Tax=Lipomyces oligophaga TaxID=45792 RepID=UPI0034CEEE7A
MYSHFTQARLIRGIHPVQLVCSSRQFASLATLEKNYLPGQQINGFTVTKTKTIPELEMVAVHLKHDYSGAEHLHVAKDDDNNVFSIAFKTNPPDATGVPHILEHTTLCGSERYNVRDPFFKMLNRSLANFMNAMTASDYTFYPFATTNKVDFGNLRNVYLDATLHPLLKNLDFAQEGWRIEHADPRDETSPFEFKGVVYNEMKGQMSDTSYLFYIRFQESIYPSLNNSGGDPSNITDLTYSQLQEFHAKNYHPSNAKVFTYGNFPLEDHLTELDHEFSRFEPKKPDLEVKYPISLSDTIRVVEEGPIDPLSDPSRQHKTSMTWFMGPTTDVYETFCLRVLTSLLTDGHSSPLYQALIESDIGTEFSPNTGLDTSSPVNIFSVGVQGVATNNLQLVEQTIRTTLQQTFDDGLDLNRVEAILHQTELSRKHKVANFGMNLLYGLTSGWFNKVDPMDMLEWNNIISRFREDLKKPRFLENYIECFLLQDKPVFCFTMSPSASYGESLVLNEQERLAKKLSEYSAQEKDELTSVGLELLKKQEEKEDLSCLPTLHIQDIPRELKRVELDHTTISALPDAKIPVQWRITPTNGLTYFRSLISLKDLPKDLHIYLPLFAECLTNMGTHSQSMADLEDEIKLKTGGISTGVQVRSDPNDIDAWNLSLGISGYSLDKDVSDLLRLIRILLVETNFENTEKLRPLLRQMASGAADQIASNGHAYARNAAASTLTASGSLSESLSGIEQVQFIARLDGYDDASLLLISAKLRQISEFVLSTSGMQIAVICGENAVRENELLLTRFATELATLKEITAGNLVGSATANQFNFTSNTGKTSKTWYTMPFQVSYSGACVRGVPYTNKDGSSLQVLANMLSHKYLHSEIREKGGAYGGGASYNGASGIFGYYSYRDPNPENTLRTIDRAGEWAIQNSWTTRDLEEAKLSIFQGIDAPQSVESEGMIPFLNGISDDMRQTRREQLLSVGLDDIRGVAEKYLTGGLRSYQVAVLGEAPEWANETNGWTVVNSSVEGSMEDAKREILSDSM